MQEGGGRDTNVHDFLFCFVMPICLFVAFESMSQLFQIIYFQLSRGNNSN